MEPIFSYLNQNNINYQTEIKLDECTYDLLIGHLLVKFNPFYPITMSDSEVIADCQKLIDTAEQHDYLYLEWYDWYEPQELIDRISTKQHIYMRTCYIQEILRRQVDSFQYFTPEVYNPNNIYLGIYHKKTQQLLASYVFSQTSPHNFTITNAGYRPDVLIPGVLSKLMSYFIKKYNPETITTSVFSSKMYTACGMTRQDRTLLVKTCSFDRRSQKWTDRHIQFAPTSKYVCLDVPDTAVWQKKRDS